QQLLDTELQKRGGANPVMVAVLLGVCAIDQSTALQSGLNTLFSREAKATPPLPEVLARLVSTLPAQTIEALIGAELQRSEVNMPALEALASHAGPLPQTLAKQVFQTLVNAGRGNRALWERLADRLDMTSVTDLLAHFKGSAVAAKGTVLNILRVRLSAIPGGQSDAKKTMKVLKALLTPGRYTEQDTTWRNMEEWRHMLDKLAEPAAWAMAKLGHKRRQGGQDRPPEELDIHDEFAGEHNVFFGKKREGDVPEQGSARARIAERTGQLNNEPASRLTSPGQFGTYQSQGSGMIVEDDKDDIAAPSIGDMIAALWARIEKDPDDPTLAATLKDIESEYNDESARIRGGGNNLNGLTQNQARLQQRDLEQRIRRRLQEVFFEITH
ncbi:MAG: hypothetical protein JWQ00_2166, partial [Noviherbaspirillum sp.]|nr:hypothetical protein [Noviherbaspirillum sp.]